MNALSGWKQREMGRIADGVYLPLPVALNYPADHFVHLSVTETEADYVAYTPSEAYGEADRQVRLKFGRYLRKTFASLTDSEIQGYVTSFKSELTLAVKPATLHFATDTETINDIFETEMSACGSSNVSCMHGKFQNDTIRPYHVYAHSPDVAVAYVVADGDIVSRSVVSVKDKTWVRVYSTVKGDNDTDCGTIRQLLKDAGYTEGDLYGNRLTKLNTPDVMLPYIDNGGCQVKNVGKYWLVVEDGGDYDADLTNGEATERNTCPRCDCHQDDCECIFCDCCSESYHNGCDTCSDCEDCGRCIEHDRCHCSRCGDCERLIGNCRCTRCDECRELIDDCLCDRCDGCDELVNNCECSEDEPATETVTEAMRLEAAAKVERVWAHLVNSRARDPGWWLRGDLEAVRPILQGAHRSITTALTTEVTA